MTWLESFDLSPSFFQAVEDFATDLGGAPMDPLCVWMSESGVKATAYNPNGGASGLFQAMPDTLKGIGWPGSPADFRALPADRQVQWAHRYYQPYRGKLVNQAAWYVATFVPAELGLASDPNAVLVQQGGILGWAYAANASFDENHDLKIQVHELDDAITRACRGPRWAEISERMREQLGLEPEPVVEATPDLHTTLGIQEALAALGFDPGPLDGVPGPLTRAALQAFQRSAGITDDGVPGPITRSALQDCLAKLPGKLPAT